MASDSVVDERTLREIYLSGFEIAGLRMPWGPSDRVILRTPSRSTLRVCQKSLPERRKHFSSNVIF